MMWFVSTDINIIHQLDWVDKTNPEKYPHGHTVRITAYINGEGEWMNRFDLGRWLREAVSIYDYHNLEDYGLNTVEDLSYAVKNRLLAILRQHTQKDYVVKVVVYESPDFGFQTE